MKTLVTTVVLILSTLILSGQNQITTATDLAAINEDEESLKGNYQLMNDITVEDWAPIGTLKSPFFGTFDGNGHTITILSFAEDPTWEGDAFSTISIGLFGSVGKNALIMNLRVAGELTYDSGPKTLYMGAIAGNNEGTIRCCVSAADVNARGGRFTSGRGIGQVFLPALTGSSNAITVYQNEACGGGIVGLNKNRIENCYATGKITVSGEGHKSAGGIAGRNGFNKEGNILQCYATGDVSAQEDAASRLAGGVTGLNFSGNIINCAALNGKIEAIGRRKGMSIGGFGIAYPSNTAFGVVALNYQAISKMKNIYYRSDMTIHTEVDEENMRNNKIDEKKTLLHGNRGKDTDYALMQEQSWWSNDKSGVVFPFGTDGNNPWVWSKSRKRPILYWEMSKDERISDNTNTAKVERKPIVNAKDSVIIQKTNKDPEIVPKTNKDSKIIPKTNPASTETLEERILRLREQLK